MPIQGTAADILKRAMIDVHAALPGVAGGRARMILTVHDELLFEVPKRGRRRDRRRGAPADGRRGHAVGAAHRRRRHRRELERREELRGLTLRGIGYGLKAQACQRGQA